MENPIELSMVGSSPIFDPQCSFFKMEKMDMGVNFSITSCKEVDKEDDGKKMVVWEPKTSKECDASMRDSPHLLLYMIMRSILTMEEYKLGSWLALIFCAQSLANMKNMENDMKQISMAMMFAIMGLMTNYFGPARPGKQT